MRFGGIEPQTVLVGNTATFRWKEYANESISNVEFHVWSRSFPRLAYYYLSGDKATYYEIKPYASAVEWIGDISKNEYAFMLKNVTEFSHEKKFCLTVQYASGGGMVKFNSTALFISGVEFFI